MICALKQQGRTEGGTCSTRCWIWKFEIFVWALFQYVHAYRNLSSSQHWTTVTDTAGYRISQYRHQCPQITFKSKQRGGGCMYPRFQARMSTSPCYIWYYYISSTSTMWTRVPAAGLPLEGLRGVNLRAAVLRKRWGGGGSMGGEIRHPVRKNEVTRDSKK